MCMLHNQHEHSSHGERHEADGRATPWYRTRWSVVLIGFLVVTAYFLWTEHRTHFIQILPYALLLLCPLMHVFMHHGHGTHVQPSHQDDRDKGMP